MKLFYVRFENYNGDNLDLFVWAPDAAAARVLWLGHYEYDVEELSKGDDPWFYEMPAAVPAAACVVEWPDFVIVKG